MRVLIIDDHQIVRRGLQELLADAFPEPETGEAANSQQALELLTSRSWDLVLLDINIPGRSGLDLLQDIKRLRPKLPVVVVSAYPEEEFAIRSFKLGASGYLNKNLGSEEMLAAVRKALSGGTYVTATLAEKLAAALGKDVPQEPHETLSTRELQVLRLIAVGKTIKEVAADLALSEKTIATYRSRLAQKLALSTNVELARYALRHGLVD